MPYTIPSSTISPGTVYQPSGGLPGVIKSDARAIYATGATAFNSTRMLDLLSSHNGTRRTGEQGRAYTADGVDDEVNFGDIGTAIWFSGWVKLNSDNQCLFSLSNDTNTNVIVSAGVLTAGATLTLSAIKVDDVSKTASEAGTLLNDNGWHFLSCGIGDGLGGGSTADDVRFFTDGTNHGSVSGFDWRFWATAPTAAELTETYSGTSENRNSAALSKYALWSKGDEQDGTIAYDSSGNGNDGTITNATLANFHSTQDVWSFQNQVGYNLSGGVYIPRDESSPTQDVLGNPLTYTGQRPNDGSLKSSNCLDLNGTNQAVRVADDPTFQWSSALSVCLWVKFDNNSSGLFETIFGKSDTNQLEFFLNKDSSDNFQFRTSNDGQAVYTKTLTNNPTFDSWNHITVVYDSASGVTFYINGVTSASTGIYPSSLFNGSADLTIGSVLSNGNSHIFFNGQIVDARIYNRVLTASEIQSIYEDSTNLTTDSNLVGRWKCQEGAGTICHDSSGNENHGTIENAASNWGITQDLIHSNLLEGFSLYEHATSDAIRVPFDSSGQPLSITPPTGYSKTSDNPAGNYHNNAETTIDFDPDSTPEMGATQLGITVPSAHGFGDAWAASDQTFSRQRTLTEDRFVIMPEAQTGADLATIQKYTQP